jgi:tetratricopeptide (TPR) repeat protein
MNLWADRFEGALDDVFELQDQVTTSVIAAVSPQVERAEIARARRKTTESLDAYDFYLRGLAAYNQRTSQSIDSALRDFYRAIELGPDLAAAYAMAAMAYAMRKSRGWIVVGREGEVAESRRLARQAAMIGRDDAVTLGFSGYALAHAAGELDDGAALIDSALQLTPNLGSVLLASGWVKVWLGEPELAIQHLAQAMRLSPLDPHMYMMQTAIAHAHFFAGRFDESAAWAQRARREGEGLPMVRIAAASLALSGRADDARAAVERLLQIDPGLRGSNFHETLGPYRHREHVRQYGDALRKAGLPD